LALAGIVWVESLSAGRSNEPSRTLTLALISVGLSALFGGSVIATRLERFQFLFGRKWGWAIIIILFSHGFGFITKDVNFTSTIASSVVSVVLLSILFIVFVEVLLSVEIPISPWKAFVSSMVALAIVSAILSYGGARLPPSNFCQPIGASLCRLQHLRRRRVPVGDSVGTEEGATAGMPKLVGLFILDFILSGEAS